ENDEVGTLGNLCAVRDEIVDPEMSARRGRVFKNTGDGFLAEFASVVDALECACAIQVALATRNAPLEADAQVVLRMGLNIGDILVEEDDVFGDGVNIAARLEPLAPPGGVVVAETVRDQLRNKVEMGFAPMGPQDLKNIADPVEVYRVIADPGAARERDGEGAPALLGDDIPVLAILPFENMSTDPEQEFLADGLAEDLTSSLAQIGHLSVVPRSSAFTFKNR
ncbi:MAG: adenylate/guanylate cyclase domain-containing protein, partial [Alphaproteobacteria bacterium]